MNPLVATALVAGVRWTERLPGPTIESPEEGSPGFAGFVATFLLALAIIVLAVSFTRRMRRADHRERLRTSAAPSRGAVAGPAVPSAAAARDDAAGDDPPDDPPDAPPGRRTDDEPR
ncbi:hypothetical protein [Cellulomonas sp. S1-8]|uniref:hypothetical protein n=1 Tax=Cellulomonas sp. S1-8 TaxID=2904790 RepID=UPI002243C72A|nr:hypothetical protein [Cellulomonas sp. S1-8]UZN04349.1 hypothetical protein OKX07_05305 [Cellulomonas sp. S1-8]